MCDLSDSQAGESHGGQESVCALMSQRERCVMHISPRQHQSIVKQEQAHVGHLFVGPDHEHTHNNDLIRYTSLL